MGTYLSFEARWLRVLLTSLLIVALLPFANVGVNVATAQSTCPDNGWSGTSACGNFGDVVAWWPLKMIVTETTLTAVWDPESAPNTITVGQTTITADPVSGQGGAWYYNTVDFTPAPGKYLVKIENNPDLELTIEDDLSVKLLPAAPVAEFSFTMDPEIGVAPVWVQFLDISTGGQASVWSWDFGDGTPLSEEHQPSHTYAQGGSFTVKFTASNAGGQSTKTRIITVTNPPAPKADFSFEPQSGPAPFWTQFTDISSGGSATSWSWDFGDGTPLSEEHQPSHTFEKAGTYTVKFTATGLGGSNSTTKQIVVLDPPPTAAFTYTPTMVYEKRPVTFNDASTGVVNSWSWDFGDGVTSTEQNPAHIYQNTGTYTVSLTVVGPGGSNTTSQAIVVNMFVYLPTIHFSVVTTPIVLDCKEGTFESLGNCGGGSSGITTFGWWPIKITVNTDGKLIFVWSSEELNNTLELDGQKITAMGGGTGGAWYWVNGIVVPSTGQHTLKTYTTDGQPGPNFTLTVDNNGKMAINQVP